MAAQQSNTPPVGPVTIAMPLADYPFVESNRTLTFVWYQFLQRLLQRTGGSVASLVSGTVDAVNHTARLLINNVSFVALGVSAAEGGDAELQTPLRGADALPQVLAGSPFVFQAPFQGVLVVESGQVALGRGAQAPIVCGLAGGAIPVLKGDSVTVTWYNTPPAVVFFPGGAYPA